MEDRRNKRKRHTITKSLASAAVIILGLYAVQCGSSTHTGTRRQTSTNTAATNRPVPLPIGHYIRGDYDDDDNGGNDPDDVKTRTYGHPSTATERRAAELVIKRYYMAAAEDNGTTACRLMDPRLAKNRDYTKVVPPEYIPTLGSLVFQNKSCAQVASLVFEPTNQQLMADAATVKLIELRVDKTYALAILIYKTDPESEIPLKRERNTWKIDAFLATPLL